MPDRYVLGVTLSIHDSSACLVKNGKLVAAVEEERLARKKHTGEFPLRAITYCLSSQGVTLADLSCIAYTQVPWMALPTKVGYLLTRLPLSWGLLKREIYWHLLNYGQLSTWMERLPPQLVGALRRPPRTVYLDHHLTHAASAYFPSPFEEAALFSVDQRGEWASTFFGQARGNRLERIGEVWYPDSIGLFYLMMTLYLGFNYHEEYEVMALAAYGKPTYLKHMEDIIQYVGDMRFRLNERYVCHHFRRMYSDALVKLLGPARQPDEPLEGRHRDIAASLQAMTERVVFALLRDLHARTKLDRLCMAGGVALNSVMNGKIREQTPFREVFIQPAAYDAGGCVGAATYAAHVLLDGAKREVLEHVSLGPEFSTAEIKALLDAWQLPYTELNDVEPRTAQLLTEGKVVGWFQGRGEFGPRALGNRSILADPRKPEMKERVNLKIKERQPFRPFAPAVLQERVHDYFRGIDASPFMLFIAQAREEVKALIPAVIHVDGSARVQTVTQQANPRFWKLLRSFEQLTGIPVLLNTSFNLRGEPIVCSPKDAVTSFYTSGLDVLVMDRFLLTKDGPTHAG